MDNQRVKVENRLFRRWTIIISTTAIIRIISKSTYLSILWRNNTYEKAIRLMSLEKMKHAGGVK
jgi:hypothetical protein